MPLPPLAVPVVPSGVKPPRPPRPSPPVAADVAVVHIDQPLVGDGDAMGVAADVVEHLVRTRKGRFREDDPFGVPGRLQMIGKATRLRQGLECPGEPELARVERVA